MMLLYNTLMVAGMILGLPVIMPLVLLSRKRRATILQRLGMRISPALASAAGKQKKRIWVHALSVGEVISAVPLVRAMRERFPQYELVFSASTKTGFETATTQLREDVAALFFFPIDLIFSVQRVVGRVAPEFVVLVETDIWPNFLSDTARRQIPVFLVNTRLSEKSLKGYKRASFLTRPLFRKFAKICPQSVTDGERFQQLGVLRDDIVVTGNVKFDQPITPVAEDVLREMRQALGIGPGQKVMVAGSTHEGEETVLLDAFQRLRKEFSSLFLIIVPRNPDRARAVCRIFRAGGFSALKMAEIEGKEPQQADVMVVDRIGVLKTLYALGDLAFVGGSLVPLGGHNPLEPAALGKPVLFGPHMTDFAEISALLLRAEGAVSVTDAGSVFTASAAFLSDTDKAQGTGRRALEVFDGNKGTVGRTLDVIEAYFQK